MTASATETGAARVRAAFSPVREGRTKAIVPFVCAGFPSIEATERTFVGLSRAGATLIELGIPYSDPIADGRTIAEAMHAALQAGVTPRSAFEAARRARASGLSASTPLVAMVSASMVDRCVCISWSWRCRPAETSAR